MIGHLKMMKAGDHMNRPSESLTLYSRAIRRGPESDCEGDWVAGRSILAYGVRVGVRTNRPEYLDRILDHAPPLWKPSSATLVERLFSFRLGETRSRSAHILFDDLETAAKSDDLKAVLHVFEVLSKSYVAEMARGRVFVHAGAVGWKGKAIIIPGQTMSGKTSLVAELVRAGATYYSDEYAVLDAEGRVHPYPQPLSIRKKDRTGEFKCRVEEIGGIAGSRPLPVGFVIVSRYKAGARWRPRRLSAGEAVLELLANTVPARRKPEAVMTSLQKAVLKATTLKSARGEAHETAELILQRCNA